MMNLLGIILLSVIPGIAEPCVKAYWVPKDTTATILVDLRLPPSRIIFRKSGGVYSAGVDMEIRIKSGRERLYNGIKHFTFNLKDYSSTRADSLLLSRTTKVRVPIKKSYTVKIRVRDVENRDMLLEKKIKMGPYNLPVSDLIPINLAGYREGIKELVSTSSIPGGTLGVWVRAIGSYSVEMGLRDSGSTEWLWRRELNVSGDTVFEIVVDSLKSGSYALSATFSDSGRKDKRTLYFSVFNIGRLSEKDFDELTDILWYIAEPWEIDSLKNAPDSLRSKEWQEFWKRRDPTPGTPENEFMEKYIERVKYANAHFSYGNIPGYKTDRGMIYIKYGPPDEIERHPFELDSPPYEIWRYYSLGLTFIFVDKSGVGDYELVYPNSGYPFGE